MKTDLPLLTTKPHVHEALRSAHGGAESRIPRVVESERATPDRDRSAPGQLPPSGVPEAASATQKVRELAARLIRLGAQAKKLVKKNGPKRFLPVDEKV